VGLKSQAMAAIAERRAEIAQAKANWIGSATVSRIRRLASSRSRAAVTSSTT
jgi:hypothetical protein